MKHPTNERTAAYYHGFIAMVYAAGFVWHVLSTIAHWRDRDAA